MNQYWSTYFKDVLGVESIYLSSLLSDKQTDSSIHLKDQRLACELLIINIKTQDKEDWQNPAVLELYQKMKAAMKLDGVNVLEWQFEDSIWEKNLLKEEKNVLAQQIFQKFTPDYVLVFSSFPYKLGELRCVGSSFWMETYCPTYLLEDASAKKVVWKNLQTLLLDLKRN